MRFFSQFKNKTLLITIVTVIAVAVTTVVLVCLLSKKNDDFSTVLTVAGEDVAYGEFMLAMDAKRTDVATYFYEKYHLDNNVYLWDKETDYNGEKPLLVLKEKATEHIKIKKYQQHLMKEYGIVDDISYKKFLELWEKDSKERAQKLKDNIPVYGPTEYSKADYYDYLHSIRIDDLRKALYEESELEDIEYRFSDKLLDKKMEEELQKIEVKINKDVYDNITY